VAAHGDGSTTALLDEPSARKPSINGARDSIAYLRDDGDYGVPYVATDLTGDGFASDHRLFPSETDVCAHSNRPSWSPEGDRLAIVCVDGPDLDRKSLRVATLDGELGPPLEESSGLRAGPSWADDGTIYYADSSESSRFDALWALPDGGAGDAEQVAECDGTWLSNPDWGPPGVLFTCGDTRTGAGQLELMLPDRTVVPLGDEPVAWATWSTDHRAIAALVGDDLDDRRLVTAPFTDDGDGEPQVGTFEPYDLDGTLGEPAWGSR
jgi:hypothetical protein